MGIIDRSMAMLMIIFACVCVLGPIVAYILCREKKGDK